MFHEGCISRWAFLVHSLIRSFIAQDSAFENVDRFKLLEINAG